MDRPFRAFWVSFKLKIHGKAVIYFKERLRANREEYRRLSKETMEKYNDEPD